MSEQGEGLVGRRRRFECWTIVYSTSCVAAGLVGGAVLSVNVCVRCWSLLHTCKPACCTLNAKCCVRSSTVAGCMYGCVSSGLWRNELAAWRLAISPSHDQHQANSILIGLNSVGVTFDCCDTYPHSRPSMETVATCSKMNVLGLRSCWASYHTLENNNNNNNTHSNIRRTAQSAPAPSAIRHTLTARD